MKTENIFSVVRVKILISSQFLYVDRDVCIAVTFIVRFLFKSY